MAVKQLTVFVENQPGKLAEITRILAGAAIDMKALSIADTRDFGILRLIVSDTEKAEAVLKIAGFLVQVTEVVGVRLSDTPGALSRALEALDAGDVNIEYLYAFLAPHPGSADVVLRVANNADAERILHRAGFTIL